MLIVLILVLLLVWSAVIWSIYSNFLVFYSNFRETEDYHKAYYASISALERWELVTKQHVPWYVGSGGFKMWTWTWSVNNTTWWSDGSLSGFSYFWTNSGETTVFWTVNSRTKRIPTLWEWDVEEIFVTWDVRDYNMMDYENAEVFLLSYDKETRPYKTWQIMKSFNNITSHSITWIIRLPLAISGEFWNLDENASVVSVQNSLPSDDAIVDRQIRWQYNWNWFIIYSTPAINYDRIKPKVEGEKDSVFRESDVNGTLKFKFWNNYSPLDRTNSLARHTVISQEESRIVGTVFSHLFADPRISWLQLRFSLLNVLKSKDDDEIAHTYPFLEYYAYFWTGVADKYYHINAEWNYKDYQINLIIHKPTVKETVLWSFTTIF